MSSIGFYMRFKMISKEKKTMGCHGGKRDANLSVPNENPNTLFILRIDRCVNREAMMKAPRTKNRDISVVQILFSKRNSQQLVEWVDHRLPCQE